MIIGAQEHKPQDTSKKVRYFLSHLCLVLLCLVSQHFAHAGEWEEEKGDHFLVYHQGNSGFAKEVKRQAEIYYDKIASDLGYPRHDNFWSWENRVKIYIHPTEDAFQKATGREAWTKGVAYYDEKKIVTYEWSEGFMDALLPHEMTHLVFRDFVGFKGEVPLWLDEGVAQWEEHRKRAIAREVALFLVKNAKHYPLEDLTRADVRGSQDEDAVRYFYMQSVSLVDFMIRRHGAQSFTVFCRGLKDGKTLDAALKSAYPNSIGDLKELEEKWKKDVLGG